MSKFMEYFLELRAANARGAADGSMRILDDGQVEPIELGRFHWHAMPETETEGGSVLVREFKETESQEVSFSGDFWRLIESSGLVDDFLTLCVTNIETALKFVDIVEMSLAANQDPPQFFEGLVTADHTMSARIFSPTADPATILERAREELNAFEINEGNQAEFYFGAGTKDDVKEIELHRLLDRHLARARAVWIGIRQNSLPEENATLKKAIRDLLASSPGAADHRETIEAARALIA